MSNSGEVFGLARMDYADTVLGGLGTPLTDDGLRLVNSLIGTIELGAGEHISSELTRFGYTDGDLDMMAASKSFPAEPRVAGVIEAVKTRYDGFSDASKLVLDSFREQTDFSLLD